MTLRSHEIVDCGAFCKVIFFCISPKNLLEGFFDSLAMNVAFLNLRKGYYLKIKPSAFSNR